MVLGEANMRYNKEELAILARGDQKDFDKEGALFMHEKLDRFFKRNESKRRVM